ncbi:hypothetical protein AGR1A_Lc100009 [Agrobacterium fabacearum CFBP 5771]|nr:hypothetical protein AGR1A_Lc100009 [Agrobacterium fabacearum CFBP 5771]
MQLHAALTSNESVQLVDYDRIKRCEQETNFPTSSH